MAKYIEKGTNYAYIIQQIKGLNFSLLRAVSVEFTKRLPAELSSKLYKDIQHGVCQLQSEPELNMYIHALGMMHEAKLHHAFEHLRDDFFDNEEIDIIDYGCGQAIGTICYADFLRKIGKSQNIRRITLIEPSERALKRAALHVSCFFPNAEIVTILKGFDDLIDDDISVDGDVPTLHILSNVIDLADDCFNLEDFTTLIKDNIKGENHFVCIEPYFGYDEEDDKLQRFIELLDAEIYYTKVFYKGKFVEGREWTCNVAIGSKINKNTLCKPKDSSFDLKIKQLIKNGGKFIKNCKVKNVTYSNNDGKIIVKFVLTEPIRDYVLCADGVNYKIGKTDIIYSSIYAVFEILLEDDTLCWLGNVILENPSVLNEVFQGAIVDVLQQEVFKGEEYINPFLENYKQKTINSDRNFIVNHCVKFYLSEAGEKVSDDIMNVIFGYIDDNNIKILMNFASNAKKQRRYKSAFNYYKLAVEKCYVEAQYCFGDCYYYGQGVDKNEEEAVKWYRKSAEQGYAKAQFRFGYCLEFGKGVSKNQEEAVKWYLKSANQGNADAQFNLALCYVNGQGVDKDEFEAVKWYRKSAEQGNIGAQNNLGVCYENGRGVFKNPKEAVEWYLKSAEQGNAIAQCNLGTCFEYGNGVVKNDDEAIKWYIKAANQGNERADRKLSGIIDDITRFEKNQARLVKMLKVGINVSFIPKNRDIVDIVAKLDANKREFTVQEKELNRCIKAANLGYSKSQNCLGLYYRIKGNYKEAVKWLFLAAREGYPESQFDLGYCLFYGYGVEKNEDEAIDWYMKSAKQGYESAKELLMGKDGDLDWLIKIAKKGYVDAQYKLGFLYQNGGNRSIFFGERNKYRVEQSYEKAISWYLLAAENGSIEAQFSLGLLYERGEGVEQSYKEAAKRYSLAAEQGSEDAKCSLAKLYAFGKGVDKSMEMALKLLEDCANKEKELYSIGRIFYEGVEVEKSYEEAIKWWKLAVEKDYRDAEFMLAVCYEKGYGVEQSYIEAIKWYFKVVENKYEGNTQNIVGVYYEKGLGVEQSYTEAVKWYLKAVENGDRKAMFNLANCYRYGRGVERSYSSAVKWYKESNIEEAQQALKEIYDVNNPFIRLFKRIKFNLGKLQ